MRSCAQPITLQLAAGAEALERRPWCGAEGETHQDNVTAQYGTAHLHEQTEVCLY